MSTVTYYRSIRLPMFCKGFTIEDSNGEYNIYINDRLSPEETARVVQHEEFHIFRGDFMLHVPAHIIEKAATLER